MKCLEGTSPKEINVFKGKLFACLFDFDCNSLMRDTTIGILPYKFSPKQQGPHISYWHCSAFLCNLRHSHPLDMMDSSFLQLNSTQLQQATASRCTTHHRICSEILRD
jgi:hypothetical protein